MKMTAQKLALLAVGALVSAGAAYLVISPMAKQAANRNEVSYEAMDTDDIPQAEELRTVEEADETERSEEEERGEDDGDEDDRVEVQSSGSTPKSPTQPVAVPVTQATTPTPTSTPSPTPIPTPTTPTRSGYTLADVAKHASADSCWTAINGSVYDITSYISRHPGGERNIMKVCGKDGSSLFEGQHGGESRPENTLAKMRIGDLI